MQSVATIFRNTSAAPQLVASTPRCIEAVIRAKGAQTKYRVRMHGYTYSNFPSITCCFISIAHALCRFSWLRFLGHSKLEQRKAGHIPMRLIIGILLTREEENEWLALTMADIWRQLPGGGSLELSAVFGPESDATGGWPDQ